MHERQTACGHLCVLCVSLDGLIKRKIALRNQRNSTLEKLPKKDKQSEVVFASYQLFRSTLGALEAYISKSAGYFKQSSEAKEPA